MILRPHPHFDHLDESTLAISRSDRRRNCAYEKKKKEKKKGKEPWYTHNPANITLSILFDRCRKTGRGPPPLCARQRESASEGDRLLSFPSFFHQSANNSAHVRPEIRLSPWETASNQDEWPSSTYTLFQPPSFHSIPGQAIGLRYCGSKN